MSLVNELREPPGLPITGLRGEIFENGSGIV
jgi:hypothetical protein